MGKTHAATCNIRSIPESKSKASINSGTMNMISRTNQSAFPFIAPGAGVLLHGADRVECGDELCWYDVFV